MRHTEPVIEDSRSVEDVHHLRLMALLHELVRVKGNKGTAAALGIDPRTVASCIKTGRLSWRVREALEQGATVGGRLGGGPAAGAQRCPGAARGGTGTEAPKPSQGKRPPCLPQVSATLLRIRHRLGH